MRPSFVRLIAAALVGCGLDVTGTLVASDGGPGSPDGAAPAGDGASVTTDGEGDAGSLDAGAKTDASPLPLNPGPPTVYVVSTRFWIVDPVTMTWTGGTALSQTNCPALEDLAVDPYGRLFASAGAGGLYRLDPTSVTCTRIGSASGYPKAISFAPRGTFDPDVEELVGYMSNGDYVRIDTATGAITVKTPGALAGFSPGDLVNVGAKGFVVMRGSTCGIEDCVWEVSLATGMRASAAPIGNFPSDSRVVTGLAHWGGQLLGFASTDRAIKGPAATPAAATPQSGPTGFSSVGYRGAASTTTAPTQ